MQRTMFRVVCGILVAGLFPSAAHAQLVTAPGPGRAPEVRVIEPSGAERTFMAYTPGFFGGVRVALGDVNGDGVRDIITAPGPGGGPHVRIWSGVDLTEIGGFFAYTPAFAGGVYVAAGDVDGDGHADIITGAGAGGGPHVRIWSGATFTEIGGFFAYNPAFAGGVRVATGDVNGDGREDIITAPGAGGGPHVRVWSGSDLSEIFGFFAYDPAFAGGVSVAAADIDGDGRADIITGAGAGGGPHVRIWSGMTFAEIGGFFAFEPTFTGGVVVGAVDLTTDERPDVVVGVAGGGPPVVAVWNGTDLSFIGALLAYEEPFNGGVFVGSVGSMPGLRFTSATSTTFTAGSAGTFSVTTAGGNDVPALSVTGTLPAGVTFTDNGNRTATLAGTPGATTGGAYNLVISADNGTDPAVTQNFTLTVNQAPAITSAASAAFSVGTPGTFTVTTTGFPTPTISSTVGLPTGVTLTDNGNGTATIAGTPASGTGGTYPITITAMNGVGSVATQSFTLTVSGGPAITSANTTTFTVGSAGSFTVTSIGSPTPALSVTGSLPTGVTFADNGNGTATLSGTPAAATGAAYALTFTASNGVLPNATQNFTLTVNQAPAVTSGNATSFTIGVPGSFSVTTTAFPTATLAQGGAALPTGVTFVDNLNGTGTLSGTPSAGTAGPYALTFTASNGVGSPAVQSFTLTVACVAITVSPAAGALPGATFQQAYSQTFTALGGSSHTFSITAGALPSGLTLATNGALTGSPTTTGNFSFTVTANSFGCTGSTAYTLAVTPDAQNEAFNNGVGNTQYVVSPTPSSGTPAVLATGTVLSNDTGVGSLTAGPASISTANGGDVALGSDGSFVYTPAVGFAGPSDTFVYTLTDQNGMTDTATVTINLSGVIWFVNSAGPNGDGRSNSPFHNVASAETPSLPGQTIYVHTGAPGGLTPGAIVLKPSQTLWGAGLPFSMNGLSIPFTGYPTILGTITLANDVLVSSVRINSSTGPAIAGANLTGTEQLSAVNILGGTSGIILSNIGGTVAFSTVGVANLSTGPSFQVNGGNGTLFGRLEITNTLGRSVDIQNKTGGTVLIGSPISDTGLGVFLNNNSGTQFVFEGGLNLSTGANAAFTAMNSGTLIINQDNGVVNTLTTTTGIALQILNTTIGSDGVTFRSISSNGAANGIVLTNTGPLAGLTVTGNATAGSGGTIQSSTNAGVALTTTGPVAISLMNVQNGLDDGIRGANVAGFSLTDVNVTSNGNASGHSGIELTELTGTASMTNTVVTGSANHNVRVANTSGTLTSFNVSGSTFGTTNAIIGGDGFLVENNGTGAMTVSISGSTFVDNRGNHFHATTDATATGSLNVTLNNNTLSTTGANDPNVIGGGIRIAPSGSADVTFTITNNNIQQAFDHAINVNQGAASTAAASLVGAISTNVIGAPADVDSGSESGTGINATSGGAGATTIAITNNQVYQYGNPFGIHVDNQGSSTMNATVTGNTVANPGTFAINGIHVNAGAVAGDSGFLCVAVSGNAAAGSGPDVNTDIRLRQRFNTTIQLPGYSGANSDTTAVNVFVAGNNAGTDVNSVHNVGGGGGGFVGGAGCITP